eukprot:189515_1
MPKEQGKSGTIMTPGMALFALLCIATVMQFALIVNTHLFELYTTNGATLNAVNDKPKQHIAVEQNHSRSNQSFIDIDRVKLSSSQWFCLSNAVNGGTCTILFNKRLGIGFKSSIWSVNVN